MTQISKLLAAINNDPAYMTEMDWREETDWFDKERMKAIIMGIENDEVCTLAGEMIIENWYIACLKETWDPMNRKRGLKDKNDWDFNGYVWRFCESQYEPSYKYEWSIENFMVEVRGNRDVLIIRQQRINHLCNMAKQFQSPQPSASERREAIDLHTAMVQHENAMMQRDMQWNEISKNTKAIEKKITQKDESVTSAHDHFPEEIIQYVMKLHPVYVSEKWEEHYRSLWEAVLQIPEVKAVVYNKGRQKNTTFNRNLVGNILCLMADKKVLCGNNATKFTIALENDEGSSIRSQIGRMPERLIKNSVTKTIESFFE